jgi:hypothetical protein
MKNPCIFIVFGNSLNKDLSNVQTINTDIIPNVGERIYLKSGGYLIKDKIINYSQVEHYGIDDPNRGGGNDLFIS